MNKRCLSRYALMWFFFCLMLVGTSCNKTPANMKRLDDSFNAQEYARTVELASSYLEQEFHTGYLLYKGVASSYLGRYSDVSRTLQLYLASTPLQEPGRELALETILACAAYINEPLLLIQCAQELRAGNKASLHANTVFYQALQAIGDSRAQLVLENDVIPYLDTKDMATLAVQSSAQTQLIASSLQTWYDASGADNDFLKTLDQAVSLMTGRQDAALLLPLVLKVYEDGLFQTTAQQSLIACLLGDIYLASGQKVLARRYWNESIRLEPSSRAQQQLAKQ